jgi:hypothetical protein
MIISLLLSFVFLTDFPICTAPGYQEEPSVAFDGEKYLVVWIDERSGAGKYDIWGQFVGQSGALIDTNFPICVAESIQSGPIVCFGDSNYLVVWWDHRNETPSTLHCRMISTTGALLDTEFALGDTNGWLQDIAFNGSNFIVVWWYYGTYKICYRFISADGVPLDVIYTIPPTASQHVGPQIAFSGSNYLVVWEDIPPGSQPWSICGCRVSDSGVPLDTSFLIIQGENLQIIPDVASSGDNYLVIASTRDTIFGRIVSLQGEPIGEPFPVATDSPRVMCSVIWTDTAYLVTWEEETGIKAATDIYGQWVSKNGTLMGLHFVICDAYHYQMAPVSAYGDSNCLVAWDDTRGPDYDIYGSIIPRYGVEEQTELRVKNLELKVSPNPFIQKTVIELRSLEIEELGELQIYDLVGRVVKSFAIPDNRPPITTIIWDGTDDFGREVRNGIYFLKIKVESETKLKKLIKMGVKL